MHLIFHKLATCTLLFVGLHVEPHPPHLFHSSPWHPVFFLQGCYLHPFLFLLASCTPLPARPPSPLLSTFAACTPFLALSCSHFARLLFALCRLTSGTVLFASQLVLCCRLHPPPPRPPRPMGSPFPLPAPPRRGAARGQPRPPLPWRPALPLPLPRCYSEREPLARGAWPAGRPVFRLAARRT